MSREVGIPLNHAPGCLQPRGEGVEVVHQDTWMGLTGGRETLFDAEVNLPSTGTEPATTPGRQYGRLVDLRHLQNTAIKFAGGSLAAWWDSQLHVMEPLERE